MDALLILFFEQNKLRFRFAQCAPSDFQLCQSSCRDALPGSFCIISKMIRINEIVAIAYIIIAIGSPCVVPFVHLNSQSTIINNLDELKQQFKTNVAKAGYFNILYKYFSINQIESIFDIY